LGVRSFRLPQLPAQVEHAEETQCSWITACFEVFRTFVGYLVELHGPPGPLEFLNLGEGAPGGEFTTSLPRRTSD
jgi:hypothetical protein